MALVNQTVDARLFCVGDDWQSIYGFTGSDIAKTTKFLQLKCGNCLIGSYIQVSPANTKSER